MRRKISAIFHWLITFAIIIVGLYWGIYQTIISNNISFVGCISIFCIIFVKILILLFSYIMLLGLNVFCFTDVFKKEKD